MEKNKFCDELVKKGYDASIESGVVYVKKAGKVEAIVSEIKALAETLGYNESIGVKAIAQAKEPTSQVKETKAQAQPQPSIQSLSSNDVNSSSFEQMSLF